MENTLEVDGKTFAPLDHEPLTVSEWPCVVGESPQPTLTLKDDDLFLITDHLGNITGYCTDDRNASMGLFCHDTRFLSRLEFQIEKRSPVLLSSTAEQGFTLSVLCANPRLNDDLPAETIGIRREIVLNGGLFEQVEISNYNTHTVKFEVSLSFAADFLDLFEIRGFQRGKKGQRLQLVQPPATTAETDGETELIQQLVMAYKGLDGSLMESRLEFANHQPTRLEGNTAIWELDLASHKTITLGYRLELFNNNHSISQVRPANNLIQAKSAQLFQEEQWIHEIGQFRSDKNTINRIISRAEQDIYILRQTFGNIKAISAGVPWFSTLFGRDALITASQCLVLDASIARDTLKILAHYQGQKDDDWRDEQPGKILHELRLGEMARCQEIPHTPYYGTVDATPLWLMLYTEYYAWTGDRETLDKLWSNALAAMDWIDRNFHITGYLTYSCKSTRGLANQGWKDSGDCIVDSQGKQPYGAIALCEVQAYVYAAKVRLSQIARLKKRIDLAERWEEEARDLKMRFNRDFWMPDRDFCAVAIDGEGNQIDGITSNPGQCLSFGILTDDKAHSVAERLLAPDMYNGWGIRTLSSLSPAYNPMGYHVGSVWPHDNSLIALGLRSLGLVDRALEVFQGLIDMTLEQPYQRPPELFCGYQRNGEKEPVKYPVACSPQAWATGSIFQLLQMVLNLVPDAPNNCLRIIDPALPESINRLSLKNLRVGTTILDLEFERSDKTTACRVERKRGNLRVVIEA
jgi:glycogen debranching enzyme